MLVKNVSRQLSSGRTYGNVYLFVLLNSAFLIEQTKEYMISVLTRQDRKWSRLSLIGIED
jgi:hypothetical protein